QLAGNVIPQAHPTGYPLYRLEWQSLGSLERRLRNCLTGLRAEPYDFGASELVDLELYLMWRARGMTMESPAGRPGRSCRTAPSSDAKEPRVRLQRNGLMARTVP